MVLSFMTVHVGPCCHILCSVQTRRNCVQLFNVFFRPTSRNIIISSRRVYLYRWGTKLWRGKRPHEVQIVQKKKKKKKKQTSDMFWFLFWTLVCCSAKPTAVECYLFIWIYFNEVCYWSELHIYFVNHECLRYKFVYFNNKCHTKQTCWCKTWVGFFKAFGPSYLWKQIYGTIEIFGLKP